MFTNAGGSAFRSAESNVFTKFEEDRLKIMITIILTYKDKIMKTMLS